MEKREPCCREYKLMKPHGEQYGGSLKDQKQRGHMTQHLTSGHVPEENHNSKRHMHANVHCSTIYNSQDMEPT